MPKEPRPIVIYAVALAVYLLGVWLHLPGGGGHIYSDIPVVFQARECLAGCTPLPVPYLQAFIEYPVIVAFFIYSMGALALQFPGDLITNYYLLSAAFLAIPTFLLIRELILIGEARKLPKRRVLWYLVITPTFIFMLLLNWYVIGVYFAVSGIRRYLQGNHAPSGLFFGLSAASNLVTAVPSLGLFLALRSMKARAIFLVTGLATYALINAPVLILNPQSWFAAYQYVYNWNIEDSWMMYFLDELSPLRHTIPLLVFGGFVAFMVGVQLWRGRTRKGGNGTDVDHFDRALALASLSMFAYVFATYIYTPQMNLTLLPFFVLLPWMANSYWEFLAFDAVNSLVIILGFSQALLVVGMTYNFQPSIPFGKGTVQGSLIWWLEIIRSVWVGKFAVVNGIYGVLARGNRKKNDGRRVAEPVEELTV